jgi:hypothetical protein
MGPDNPRCILAQAIARGRVRILENLFLFFPFFSLSSLPPWQRWEDRTVLGSPGTTTASSNPATLRRTLSGDPCGGLAFTKMASSLSGGVQARPADPTGGDPRPDNRIDISDFGPPGTKIKESYGVRDECDSFCAFLFETHVRTAHDVLTHV